MLRNNYLEKILVIYIYGTHEFYLHSEYVDVIIHKRSNPREYRRIQNYIHYQMTHNKMKKVQTSSLCAYQVIH